MPRPIIRSENVHLDAIASLADRMPRFSSNGTKVSSASSVAALPDAEFGLIAHVLSGPREGDTLRMFPRHSAEAVKESSAWLEKAGPEFPQDLRAMVKESLDGRMRLLKGESVTDSDPTDWYIASTASPFQKASSAGSKEDFDPPKWTVKLSASSLPMQVVGLSGLKELVNNISPSEWCSTDLRKIAGVLIRGQQLYSPDALHLPEWVEKISGTRVSDSMVDALVSREILHPLSDNTEQVRATHRALCDAVLEAARNKSSAAVLPLLEALDTFEATNSAPGDRAWDHFGHVHAVSLTHPPRKKSSAAVESVRPWVPEDNPTYLNPSQVPEDAVTFDDASDVVYLRGEVRLLRKHFDPIAEGADMSWADSLIPLDPSEWKKDMLRDPVAVFEGLPKPVQDLLAPEILAMNR